MAEDGVPLAQVTGPELDTRVGCPERAPPKVTALLHPPRWLATCELPGVHSGERILPDTEEAAGSIPAAPT